MRLASSPRSLAAAFSSAASVWASACAAQRTLLAELGRDLAALATGSPGGWRPGSSRHGVGSSSGTSSCSNGDCHEPTSPQVTAARARDAAAAPCTAVSEPVWVAKPAAAPACPPSSGLTSSLSAAPTLHHCASHRHQYHPHHPHQHQHQHQQKLPAAEGQSSRRRRRCSGSSTPTSCGGLQCQGPRARDASGATAHVTGSATRHCPLHLRHLSARRSCCLPGRCDSSLGGAADIARRLARAPGSLRTPTTTAKWPPVNSTGPHGGRRFASSQMGGPAGGSGSSRAGGRRPGAQCPDLGFGAAPGSEGPLPPPPSGSGTPLPSPLTDMACPASWYPLARSLRRRVVAHLGPTNSGKTHAALQALKAAPNGIYCGPLRLLACEVADRLAAEGLPCHLLTGQEVRAAAWAGGQPASHTACTVEMADVTRGSGGAGGGGGGGAGAPLHVAVLDEIQMLGDRHRGWAWTRALLGLAAREVHVAGDPAVLPVLRELVAECGDELRVVHYRRLSPLVVQSEALGSMAAVQGGDCVVGFSRRSLHGLRREVMRRTGREACLVYGALPPEARRQQAALFNSSPAAAAAAGRAAAGEGRGAAPGAPTAPGDSEHDADAASIAAAGLGRRPPAPHPRGPAGAARDSAYTGSSQRPGLAGHDSDMADDDSEVPKSSEPGSGLGSGSRSGPGSRVLCASDAIGMGLNLNIRRVVFTSLHKYDGRSVRPLQASEVRQIAGRAGRFSSAHPTGYVTSLHPADLPALHRALAERPQPVQRACLLPRSEDLAAYAAQHPDRPLATSLLAFAAAARLGSSYMYGNYEGMYRIASALRHLDGELSAEEMILFSTAPADMDDPAMASALLRFAELYSSEGRVGAEAISPSPPPQAPPQSEVELKRLEELHRAYDLYVWLCFRLPYAFTDREEAEAARATCGGLIEEGLDRLAAASAAAFGRRNHNHNHNHSHQQEQGEEEEEGVEWRRDCWVDEDWGASPTGARGRY